MSDLILNICFFTGIILLIVCILLLRSSQRKKFDNTPQIIQIWGLKLEVSILTLLFLISVGLIATNIWFQLQRINDQIRIISAEKEKALEDARIARRDLEKATTRETEAYVTLDGVSDVTKLQIKDLSCTYTTRGGATEKAEVASTAGKEAFKITFKNLSRETIITSVDLADLSGEGTIWSGNEEFQPLKPHTLRLTKMGPQSKK